MSEKHNFETTFNDLGLSEIPSDSKKSYVSASAQFLEVKRQEMVKKQREEEEEMILQQKAVMKAKSALDRIKRDQEKTDNLDGHHALYGALISMHGNDFAGGKKQKSSTKTKARKMNRRKEQMKVSLVKRSKKKSHFKKACKTKF